MKSSRSSLLALALFGTMSVNAQTSTTTSITTSTASQYTNFIRQIQSPSNVQWDASVLATGTQNAVLPIDTKGANFQLWTVKGGTAPASHMLDSKFVSSFSPTATIQIRTEDPYALVPRTRCDRPFSVDVTVDGLVPGNTAVSASGKSVNFLRHVQSYGTLGSDAGINRTQATLLSQAGITANGKSTLNYSITAIPGADLTKINGEERFSVFTVQDGSFPVSQLASKYVQIWPLATGKIIGITPNAVFRFKMPYITVALDDLYPTSDTYVQVYQGPSKLNVTGTRISSVIINDAVSVDRVLNLKDYDSNFTTDGLWTMEVLTNTPFGTDRLHSVSFNIDRTLEVNSMISTNE